MKIISIGINITLCENSHTFEHLTLESWSGQSMSLAEADVDVCCTTTTVSGLAGMSYIVLIN